MSEYIGRFIDLLATTLRQTVYDLVIALQQLFELSPTLTCRLSLLHSSPAPHICVGLVFRYAKLPDTMVSCVDLYGRFIWLAFGLLMKRVNIPKTYCGSLALLSQQCAP